MVPTRPGWNQAGPPGATCIACGGAPAAASAASASVFASNTSTALLPFDQWRPPPVGFAAARRIPVAAVN
jgi:hypothetical protein